MEASLIPSCRIFGDKEVVPRITKGPGTSVCERPSSTTAACRVPGRRVRRRRGRRRHGRLRGRRQGRRWWRRPGRRWWGRRRRGLRLLLPLRLSFTTCFLRQPLKRLSRFGECRDEPGSASGQAARGPTGTDSNGAYGAKGDEPVPVLIAAPRRLVERVDCDPVNRRHLTGREGFARARLHFCAR